MNCPRCRDDLRQTERTGVVIDFCPRCRGVWLDGGELEKIIDRSYSWESSGYAAGHSGDTFQQPGYRPDPPPQHHDLRSPQQQYDSYRHDYERRDYERHDYDRRDDHYQHRGHRKHKKKSLLGELFDIFD